jgi:hypothetical protein
MVTDHSPYRVIQTQEFPPGTCFVTGTPNGPFIDTGIFIRKERFGQLVLSKDFIEQAARELGLFEENEQREQDAYDRGYQEATKENLSGILDRALDELGFAVSVIGGLRSGSVADVDLADGEDQAAAGDVDSAESADAGADEAAGQGDGAAVDEGPDVVPAGAGDVGPFRV